ncbi:5676_t:CDS:10 [Ambispora gerdemannii]|uniref:DNA-directed RNA polymerase n=1 Tax=Ambispora gerdemannii TaxID=144530 RepID=A0A9N9AWL7_9GLOM|nr:5676_t:CDS:10 [Ambispora gerdemannii]
MLNLLRATKLKCHCSKGSFLGPNKSLHSNSLTANLELLLRSRTETKIRSNFINKENNQLYKFSQLNSSRIFGYGFSSRLNYSTVTDTLPEQSFDHLILSQPSYGKDGKFFHGQFNEQLVLLYACLQSRLMDRAMRIFKNLYKNSSEDQKNNILDINVHNAILLAFTSEPFNEKYVADALRWYDDLRKKYKVKPNLMTFSIIIKGVLRDPARRESYVKVYVEEMQHYNLTVEDLLKSSHLNNKELKMLTEVIDFNNYGIKLESLPVELMQEIKSEIDLSKPDEPEESLPDPILMDDAIGVKLMKNSLEALKDKTDPMTRQMKLEANAYQAAIERWKYDKERFKDMATVKRISPLRQFMWNWHSELMPLIQEEQKRVDKLTKKSSHDATQSNKGEVLAAMRTPRKFQLEKEEENIINDRTKYGPYFLKLSPEKLSAITIIEILRLQGSGGIRDGMKSASALLAVGKAVEAEYNSEMMKKKLNRNILGRFVNIQELYQDGKLFQMAVRRAQAKIEQEEIESEWKPIWPPSVAVQRADANGEQIQEYVSAFTHNYRYINGKQVGVIRLRDVLVEMLSSENINETIHPRMLPMLVLPKPWLTYNSGGYYTSQSDAMRIKNSHEQFEYLREASKSERLDLVFAGLDVLGSTKWAINKNVYKVVLEVWNSGKSLGGIPPIEFEGPEPKMKQVNTKKEREESEREFRRAMKEHHIRKTNNRSERCSVNYKVQIAGAFLNEALYFPHNLDFRGRAYAIPPHFNHLGDDLCRGLLLFHDGKPLGAEGFRWLKVHLSNLCGVDKVSLEDRVKYAEENIDNILDSANNPLIGKRWWLNAEDPWQCLATCFEIAEAHKSGNPENYVSRIPVHQDGTCNGLQHYAALGGDPEGAKQVNLQNSDTGKPADIYTGVAERVTAMIKEDAKKGDPLAEIAQNIINRKLVKQTVMTNVYGVTFVGARTQIENRLKERGDINPEKLRSLSAYITKQVFLSLRELFTRAREIQDWLTESARRISKSMPIEKVKELDEAKKQQMKKISEHEAKELDKTKEQPRKIPEHEVKELDETKKQLMKISEHEVKELDATKKQPMKELDETKKQLMKISEQEARYDQVTSVIWTTPLQLTIVQPYRKLGKQPIKTNLQSITVENPDKQSPVNSMKQAAAFPPNFIHSLDATHMLMSALACKSASLTFASVHDSYWTHACDIPKMSKILREEFVKLHTKPIMSDLQDEFMKRYRDHITKRSMDVDEYQEFRKKHEGNVFLEEIIESDSLFDFSQELESLLNEKGKKEADRELAETYSIDNSFRLEDEDFDDFDVDEDGLNDNENSLDDDKNELFDFEKLETQKMGNDNVNETKDNLDKNFSTLIPPSSEATTADETTTDKEKTKKKNYKIFQLLTFPSLPPKGEFSVTQMYPINDKSYRTQYLNQVHQDAFLIGTSRNVSTIELSLTHSNFNSSPFQPVKPLSPFNLYTPSTMFIHDAATNSTPDELLEELSVSDSSKPIIQISRSSDDTSSSPELNNFEEVSLEDVNGSSKTPISEVEKKEKKRPKLFSIVISKASPPSSTTSSPHSPSTPPKINMALDLTNDSEIQLGDNSLRRQSSGPFYSVPMTPLISLKNLADTSKRLSADDRFISRKATAFPAGSKSKSKSLSNVTTSESEFYDKKLKRTHSQSRFFTWGSANLHPLDVYISKTRQRDLPPKSLKEEKRHMQEHENMMRRAKQAEMKKLQREQKKKQQRDKQYQSALTAWEIDIIPNWQVARHEKTTRDLWWKGIPPRCRSKVWSMCIGNPLSVSKATYDICLDRAFKAKSESSDGLESPTRRESSHNMVNLFELIENEISETLPALGLFQTEGPLCNSLRSVLEAYTFYRTNTGYVKGLNNVAAMLLLNMDVITTFACMVNLSHRPCLSAFFEKDELKIQGYLRIFSILFKTSIPKLYEHFKSLGIYPSVFIPNWFITMFTCYLPLEIASRFWDCYFLYGDIFLFRAALGILFSLEGKLYGSKDEIIGALLAEPFNCIGIDKIFDHIEQVKLYEEFFRQLVVKEVPP